MSFCTCPTRDVSKEQSYSFLLCVICGNKYHITCTNVRTDDLDQYCSGGATAGRGRAFALPEIPAALSTALVVKALIIRLFIKCKRMGDQTKWYWTKWYGQNGTDKMVRTKW